MNHKRIHSIAGLKAVSIWLIFWWHSWLTNPPCDLGARCCEFFFAASGFLVWISHKSKEKPCTWKASAAYVKTKLISIWPIHFLAFCLCLCIMPPAEILTLSTLLRGLINLLLFQSWIDIEQIFFSFNGPSWFLSSLLFCYFVTPVLLRFIRRRRKIWLIFPVVFLIRYAIEEIQFRYPNMYSDFNIHVSPVLRMMEFFLGMMAGSVWDYLREKYALYKNRFNQAFPFIGFSLLEVGLLFLTAYLFVVRQNGWGRAIFALWFCFIILVFAFDEGIISQIMALKPFTWFSSIQFEFYIFHIPIINLVAKYIEPHGFSGRALAAIAFVSTVVLSKLYRMVIKKPSEKLVRKSIDRIWAWLIS
jgi:peptidoglycan/LPS O-acetylase OafA/YrhL